MKIPVSHALALGIMLTLFLVPAAWAQQQDFHFHWAPCPSSDEEGRPLAPAVEYEVYLQQDGFESMIAIVDDTTYTLTADPGVLHRVRVCGVDVLGRPSVMSEWSDPIYFDEQRQGDQVPPLAGLEANYPNPFNPETRIVYGIPEEITQSEQVSLQIYAIDGKLVRNLEVDRTPGWHEIVWDGTNERGQISPTGLYVTRLICGSLIDSQKMTMVK